MKPNIWKALLEIECTCEDIDILHSSKIPKSLIKLTLVRNSIEELNKIGLWKRVKVMTKFIDVCKYFTYQVGTVCSCYHYCTVQPQALA